MSRFVKSTTLAIGRKLHFRDETLYFRGHSHPFHVDKGWIKKHFNPEIEYECCGYVFGNDGASILQVKGFLAYSHPLCERANIPVFDPLWCNTRWGEEKKDEPEVIHYPPNHHFSEFI